MTQSLLFRVLPTLEALDETDPLTHILPEDFVVPSNDGVVLETIFRRWVNTESISYSVRRTTDGKPTITFDDERGAVMYESRLNPLLLEVPRKFLRKPSILRDDVDPQPYFVLDLDQWFVDQNIDIETVAVPERIGYGSTKKIFIRFATYRDFIVFKLKWL